MVQLQCCSLDIIQAPRQGSSMGASSKTTFWKAASDSELKARASRSKSLRERFALIRLFSTDWSFALMAFGASFLPFGGGFGCVSWRFGGGFGSSAGAAGACDGARDPLPSRDGGGSTGHRPLPLQRGQSQLIGRGHRRRGARAEAWGAETWSPWEISRRSREIWSPREGIPTPS